MLSTRSASSKDSITLYWRQSQWWDIDAHALMWAATQSSTWQELAHVFKEHIHMFVQPPSQLLPCSDDEVC